MYITGTIKPSTCTIQYLGFWCIDNAHECRAEKVYMILYLYKCTSREIR